ncbi:MAG: hypothetical protein QNJ13_06195 [Paracoccaceae bacterium]|nr:hypothetical protein [Paracoccaceae bacterium]
MRLRMVLATLSLSLSGIAGAFLLLIGAVFAFIASSGGLYGNASLADATPSELLTGAFILVLSFVPLSFVFLLAAFWWRRARLPRWSLWLSWTVVVFILPVVFLDIRNTAIYKQGLSVEGLGVATLPSLLFALGLLGFLLLMRNSDTR